MKILQVQKDNYKQKPSSKLSIFIKVVELKSNDLKMFINSLCYDNVENYDF
jgi:hypothetical protein